MAKIRYVFNPFTGEFDATLRPTPGGVCLNVRCDETVAVGDLVVYKGFPILIGDPGLFIGDDWFIGGGDTRLIKPDDNTELETPLGIVGLAIKKPTSTTCDVLLVGCFDGLSGLTEGQPIWLGELGQITHTKPLSGIIQHLGWAKSDTEIFFEPKAPTPKGVQQTPKLIQTFDTDELTDVGDLVRISGDNAVTRINSNSSVEIPNGIFGICFNKLSPFIAEVIFVGIEGGYSGLSIGLPLFVDTDGSPTHTVPATGMVQQIGFAVSSTEIFFQIKQAMRRD